MNIDTAYRRAREGVLNALVGRRTVDGGGSGGLGIAARTVIALGTFAVTLAVWAAARRFGILGSASLFFPATLLITLFAGWEFGMAALAGSAALVGAVVHGQFPVPSLTIFALAGILQFGFAAFLRALLRDAWHTEHALQTQAEQRAREAESRELVLGESRHRLKNLMAIIEALAKFSAPRPGQDPAIDAFMHRFLGRLRTLGATSDLILKCGPDVLEARALVGAVLKPFVSEPAPRLRFDGPELELSEQFGGALAMAVHELATNALKYGALSVPSGTVSFQWTAAPRPDGEHVTFVWKEDGGPPPRPPEKDGYGHRMIRSVAAREPEGEVAIDYRSEGLVCRIAYLRRHAPAPVA